MKHQNQNRHKIISTIILVFIISTTGFSQIFTNSTTINITKTWSQEPTGYTYPMDIYVPTTAAPSDGFPVCISLHGNGGMGNANAWRTTLPNHIIVAPSGYLTSWNIADENSNAPDVEMISDLVDSLQTYTNINPTKIRILGSSNGAGLANRVFIENKDAGIDIICAIVTHLSDASYHNGGFYLPSGATGDPAPFEGYDTPTTPITGRRYLNISNTNDGVIPYYGGNSVVRTTFLAAQTAAHIVAQSQGYTGSQVMDSTQIDGANVYEFKYLNGQVVHLNGDAMHGTNATQKSYITTYFNSEVTGGNTGADKILTNNSNLTITKTWSQEPSGYTYPVGIHVPTSSAPTDGFPVCISLHGNGGMGNVNAWRNTLPNHIIVAPSGYLTSWNITDENSNAPDVEMISDLIDSLQTYTNINPNKIRIIGTSNGAGLANRVFIENKDTGLDIVCSLVSHLTTANYHNDGFYFPSGATGDNGTGTPPFEGYDTSTTPIMGRRYLGISNVNDPLIPYYGGTSRVGATFLDARVAAHTVAQSQGYTGTQIMDSTLLDGAVYEFNYLDGQVVHLSGDALHGNNPTQRAYITTYFNTEIDIPSGCEENINLTTLVTAGMYQASNEITCNNTLSANATIIFKANVITLNAGFATGTNTIFTAQIDPCSAAFSHPTSTWQSNATPFKSNQLELANKDKISIYPNPTTAIITIQTNAATPLNYTLISPLGQEIKRGILTTRQEQIDLSSLRSNIYFLTVGQQTFKIKKTE